MLFRSMHDLGVKWGISEEKMCDFGDNGGIFGEKTRVFLCYMGDSRRENA